MYGRKVLRRALADRARDPRSDSVEDRRPEAPRPPAGFDMRGYRTPLGHRGRGDAAGLADVSLARARLQGRIPERR